MINSIILSLRNQVPQHDVAHEQAELAPQSRAFILRHTGPLDAQACHLHSRPHSCKPTEQEESGAWGAPGLLRMAPLSLNAEEKWPSRGLLHSLPQNPRPTPGSWLSPDSPSLMHTLCSCSSHSRKNILFVKYLFAHY